MEHSAIHKYHDEMGHLATEKTYKVILQNYWFPNAKEKIVRYIQNCLKCIFFSPSTGKTEGCLQNCPKDEVPFSTIHVDHYSPIDKQFTSKKYIFVIIDAFTKFVKLFPTKTTNSKEVINCLTHYFSNYSRPKILLSDRGSCFTSKEFTDFINNMNVKHIKVATGSPQANGQVERVNRVLTPVLAKMTDNLTNNPWFKVLPEIEFALNNTTSKTTGETPSKLLFGVNQRGKNIDAIKEYLEENVNVKDRKLDVIRKKATDKIQKFQNYNKNYYDKKRKTPHKYEIGDYVMLRNFDTTIGTSKKLIPRFKGPYKIIKELRNNRYVVADIEGHQASQRPYQGVWEPANMRPWRS